MISLPHSLQVLVVDDHELVRLGVRHLLAQVGLAPAGAPASAPAGAVPPTVHEAATLDQALRALAQHSYDVVLLDLALGEHFALRAMPQLRAAAGKARIVVLTSMPESLYAEKALRAGADGFLMKSEIGGALLDALHTVLAGDIYLSPRQRGESLRRLANRGSQPEGPALSARELEVLRMVAGGLSTQEIADQLNRSVKTIETHKQNLKAKLGAATPAQLVRQALAWFGEGL